jgi:pyrimidine operon attenuation protein/uracil phosphoribosyltransferase
MKVAQAEIETLIGGMADRLSSLARGAGRGDLLVIGIHTGGVWVAERLRRLMRVDAPLGELNIAFYRDDFSRIGLHPEVKPSRLPFTVDDRHLVLVDDVLHTGRTVRAAMNEIFDWGRPASVCLAVLIDRGGRELPIQADVAGKSLSLREDEHVKLSGPEPLVLEITGTG